MIIKKTTLAVLAISLSAHELSSSTELTSQKQKNSYSVGYRLALSRKGEGLDVDDDDFSDAMNYS